MRSITLQSLAVSALLLASAATPSLAGSPYYDAMGAPMTADQADMTYDGMMHPEMMAARRGAGSNADCSTGQKRTHITRQNCGATKFSR